MLLIDKLMRSKRLIILDDFFPNLLSGFRIAEYNYYLDIFPSTRIYSSSQDFENYLEEYSEIYPKYKKIIEKFDPNKKLKGSLIYAVFINNIYSFLPFIEKEKIPFVFTLYPAGGFWINESESDKKLQAVCESPFFRKVIVTQKISRDYLIEQEFCKPDQIELIYGGVFPSGFYQDNITNKKYYKKDKKTFDICFVANKYMKKGVDKGYDIFIDVAKRLGKISPDFRFHVVGDFDKDDIDISDIENKITFYGIRFLPFFRKFYSGMDIILSPNVPYVLYPGNFDGFPTGCCIEAGLSEVAVFCTDPLDLNVEFIDKKDIVLIPRNEDKIVDLVVEYFGDLDRLYRLSDDGKKSFNKVFNLDHQMKDRVKILNHFI